MIVGDWAKGDFAAADKKLGTDYGCQMAPGNQDAYVMTVDVFVFPKSTTSRIRRRRRTSWRQLMMDPAVQTEVQRLQGLAAGAAGRQCRRTRRLRAAGPEGDGRRRREPVAELRACLQPGHAGPDRGPAGQLLGQAAASPADAAKQLSTIIANAESVAACRRMLHPVQRTATGFRRIRHRRRQRCGRAYRVRGLAAKLALAPTVLVMLVCFYGSALGPCTFR